MNELQLQVKALVAKFDSKYYQSIDVDEGWYQIVVDCDKQLSAIDPQYTILQIKQKFGGLRYYFQPSSSEYNDELWEKMNAIVHTYEDIAWVTCEVTGNPGVLMKSSSGWYKTLDPEWAKTGLFHTEYTVVNKAIL